MIDTTQDDSGGSQRREEQHVIDRQQRSQNERQFIPWIDQSRFALLLRLTASIFRLTYRWQHDWIRRESRKELGR